MKAEHQSIRSWYSKIRDDEILVPSYQRNYVWKKDRVVLYLNALLNEKHPIGIFLVHGIETNGNHDNFKKISISQGIEIKLPKKRYELLLDGRQRLTTLWGCFLENNEEYVCHFKIDNKYRSKRIISGNLLDLNIEVSSNLDFNKMKKKDLNSDKTYTRYSFPFNFLSPGDGTDLRIMAWENGDNIPKPMLRIFKEKIIELRKMVSNRMIPYFSLSSLLTRGEAINIFIRTNISSLKLTPFEIKCAEMEDKVGVDLRNFIGGINKDLGEKFDSLYHTKNMSEEDKINNTGDLVLKLTSVIRGDKPRGTYSDLDEEEIEEDGKLGLMELHDSRTRIVEGIDWTISVMNLLNIYKNQHLPSIVPFRVLPVLHMYLPKRGETKRFANQLIVSYIWRSLFSGRYSGQANEKLLSDCEFLIAKLKILCEGTRTRKLSQDYFNSMLPKNMNFVSTGLKTLPLPTGKSTRSRAVIMACNQTKAKDIITEDPIFEHSNNAEIHLHHIFPKKALSGLKGINPDLAVNAMYLSAETNIQWSDKLPGDYLKDKYINNREYLKIKFEELCIPYDIIIKATNKNYPEKSLALKNLYKNFLTEREKLIKLKIRKLIKARN